MKTRPASLDDLAAVYEIFRAAVDRLYRRHRFDPPDPPRDAFIRQHAHMLEHDPERFWLAEDKGRPVGFGAAILRADTWFLSALFVIPASQADGVGKELFRLAWEGGGDGVRRRLTVVDSFQPVSTGLYSRAGLLPVTPLLNLAGIPVANGRPGLEPDEPDDAAVARLDDAAYRFDRAPDHAFWQRDGRPTLWRRDGEPVAYSYRWPGGRIGPVAGCTPSDLADALTAELGRAAGGAVSLVVPGTARAALQVALSAGLRYRDPPGLVLSTEPALSPSLVPYGYSLF